MRSSSVSFFAIQAVRNSLKASCRSKSPLEYSPLSLTAELKLRMTGMATIERMMPMMEAPVLRAVASSWRTRESTAMTFSMA